MVSSNVSGACLYVKWHQSYKIKLINTYMQYVYNVEAIYIILTGEFIMSI